MDGPLCSNEKIAARCAIDLSGVSAMVPDKDLAGATDFEDIKAKMAKDFVVQ